MTTTISMEDCAFYGLDPRTATMATLAAVKQQDYEQMLQRAAAREKELRATKRLALRDYLEVKNCARSAMRRAREAVVARQHNCICKVLGIDPTRVSRERAIEMHSRRRSNRSIIADLIFQRRNGLTY